MESGSQNITLSLPSQGSVYKNSAFKIRLTMGDIVRDQPDSFSIWSHDDCLDKITLKQISPRVVGLDVGAVGLGNTWTDYFDHKNNNNCKPDSCRVYQRQITSEQILDFALAQPQFETFVRT